MYAYYTVSMKDTTPKGLIHLYESGNATVCGQALSNRWVITRNEKEVTCKECLEKEGTK